MGVLPYHIYHTIRLDFFLKKTSIHFLLLVYEADGNYTRSLPKSTLLMSNANWMIKIHLYYILFTNFTYQTFNLSQFKFSSY